MIPVLECEWDLIRKKYDCFHAKLLYHPTVIPESQFSGMSVNDNILIGNSAILTNNHLQFMESWGNKPMVNIFYSLENGIKLYLYKQSISYLELKKMDLSFFLLRMI